MTNAKHNRKTRLLNFIWRIVPWIFVLGAGIFVFYQVGQIREERVRLEKEKIAAMKEEIPPVRVITLTVIPQRLEDKISLPAEVEPEEEVMVKSEVSGQVIRILAGEGQRITEGQVLLELDSRDYRSRLEQIEANYRLARTEYERHSALAKSKATPESKLDSIRAQLEDLKAKREEARLALERTRIQAPVSCMLNEIVVEKGDFVGVGDPVAQILQLDRVKVTVGIPESDVAAVFDLDEAEVVIDALGHERVTGKKIFLARKPRTLARLYDLELAVPNPERRILPGMFARVELVKKVYEEALTIPLYAVITQGNEQYVYVEKDNIAEKRPVELGILSGWQVQVTSGLKPGDRVIVVGHRQVEPGRPLKIIRNVEDSGDIIDS